MKIVHVIFTLETGGAESLLVDIVNAQARSHDVTLFVINDRYSDKLLSSINPSVDICMLQRKPKTWSLLKILKFNYMLYRIKPDIVHSHDAAIARLIFIRGLRKILTIHALELPTRNYFRYSALVAISHAVQCNVTANSSYLPHIIENGINFNNVQTRTPCSLQGAISIVQVARLDATTKGQDLLIRAAYRLSKQGIRISVTFIGEGASYEALQVLVKKYNLTNSIQFLGRQSRSYVYSHLKQFDLMCHPSRYEGFGLTVVEGMAAGLPLLVSDTGGPYELINKGQLGYCFQSESVDSLVERILHIYKHYDEACELACRARAYAMDKYSIDKTVGAYEKLYLETLNQ